MTITPQAQSNSLSETILADGGVLLLTELSPFVPLQSVIHTASYIAQSYTRNCKAIWLCVRGASLLSEPYQCSVHEDF